MIKLRPPVISLWAIFGLQLFCAVYFGFDALADILGLEGETESAFAETVEYLVALALIIGVVFGWREIRSVSRRNARLKAQVRAASGEFAAIINEQFDAWGLTASERDVALLSIKGMSVAEIAAARGSAEGTVKAHSAAVYRKAGVTGRMQLLSLFVDDLMSERV